MHGHKGSRRMCGESWMMASAGDGEGRRHGRGHGGPFGRHRGGPFGGRGGPRMFDPGALRLVVLGLIAEEPRHGYDIIRALETKFQGAYSPSPGAIYPMLQMLEEADLVSSQANGNKRLYTITEEGRAYLAEHADELERINAQMARMADRMGNAAIGDAMRDLRRVLHDKLRGEGWTSEQIARAGAILARAKADLEDL